jgi:two-component system nitrate/nitrite response regulator NarL
MSTAGIFLVEANRLSREGMSRLFLGSDFMVVGEAGNAHDAIQGMAALDNPPDLILIDPVEDSGTALAALRTAAPEARIVVLTDELCTRRLSNALNAGAQGYLLKNIAPNALMQSLHLVTLGEKVLPTNLADLLMAGRRLPMPSSGPGAQAGLSQREVEVLRHLMTGASNKLIARTLNITEATVKVHLKSLLRKINAANRTQAAMWALNNGFDAQDERATADLLAS